MGFELVGNHFQTYMLKWMLALEEVGTAASPNMQHLSLLKV